MSQSAAALPVSSSARTAPRRTWPTAATAPSRYSASTPIKWSRRSRWGRPLRLALSYDATVLYVTNSIDGTLSIVDTATGADLGVVTVGQRPAGVSVDPANGNVWVVSRSDATAVSVIDPATYGISAVLAVGSDAVDVAIDGTARRAYVANAGDASISVVDLDALTVISTVPLTGGPSAVAVDELAQVGYVLALSSSGGRHRDRWGRPDDRVEQVRPGMTAPGPPVDRSSSSALTPRGRAGRPNSLPAEWSARPLDYCPRCGQPA